jgi:prepilin-type N-terminal cleavage/methylation domain-containing protein
VNRERDQPRPRRARRQRGFTLLELLITLAVTTIGLIGLLSLHVSIARGNDGASRFAEATQIANATVEQLRAQKLPEMLKTLTGSTTSTPPIDVVMPTVTGRANMTYRRRAVLLGLNSVSTSLWRLRIEVAWTDDGAAAGAMGGTLDHLVAAELIITVEEAL